MKMTLVQPQVPPGGLAALKEVELSDANERLLHTALARAGGSATWRSRKEAEARDLLALAQIAPRLKCNALDLSEALRAELHLRVTVPCMQQPNTELYVERHALLGVTYPEEVMTTALPGYAFVQIIWPRNVWHANVARDRGQPLCLGATLQAGIRAKEIVLLSYGALTMQSIMLDPQDSAGVLDFEAAKWFLANRDRVPLSEVPFLSNEDLVAAHVEA